MSKINPKFDTHRANSLNPNNDVFWQSRGYGKRPDNWEQLLGKEEECGIERPHSRYDIDGGYSWPFCKDDY